MSSFKKKKKNLESWSHRLHFVMTCHDKITCRKVFYFLFFQQKGFGAIHHDVHVYKP